MSARIPLTKGQYALVDESDYDWLRQWRWRLNSHGYAIRSFSVNGKEICINMHRVILNAQPGQFVDHIDGNRLNNTRANLRFVTRLENLRHKRRYRNNSTGYKGVSRRTHRWHARIGLEGRVLHLGFFDDPVVAAQVYDAAARRLFTEFAILNFPDSPTPLQIEQLVEHRLLTPFFERAKDVLSTSGAAFLCINQLRVNLSGYGQPTFFPGGYAKDHAMSIRARMSTPDKLERGDEIIGRIHKGKTEKNQTAFWPRAFSVPILYQPHVHLYRGLETFLVGVEKELIVDEDGKAPKGQKHAFFGNVDLGSGQTRAARYLDEREDIQREIENLIMVKEDHDAKQLDL